MIIVRITSGLGNQMYQYNFYRFIKELYPDVEVKADITWFYANDEHHGFELNRIFGSKKNHDEDTDAKGYKMDLATTSEIFRVTGQVPNFCKGKLARTCQFLLGPVNRILREKIHPGFVCNRIDRLESNRTDNFYEDVTHLDTSKDWYLFGFWIEEPYYLHRIDELKNELCFPDFAEGDEINRQLADEMSSCNSVSIHVRRGDYLSQTYSDKFLTLGRDYYETAVQMIKEKVDNPKFFIFSDDAQFVKEEFGWLEDKVIVTNNTGVDSFRDMQLMSLCKHNIIANSTFSQWGALLNSNEGRMVMYPAAYMTEEESEVKQMPGWIRI